MKLFKKLIGLISFCYLFMGCKEEYYPEIKPGQQSVLIVEGFLNSGGGTTTINLSRTVALYDTVVLRPELNAQLIVESKNGVLFQLNDDIGQGIYNATHLPLNAGDEYRLKIATADGKEYASDFVSVLNTPPIDSVSWKRNAD